MDALDCLPRRPVLQAVAIERTRREQPGCLIALGVNRCDFS
jgi:hypothetical protein